MFIMPCVHAASFYVKRPVSFKLHRPSNNILSLDIRYRGTRWTISRELSDAQIDLLIPPPCQIRSGERFPLPVVVRVRGRSRDVSLSVNFAGSSAQWSCGVLSKSSGCCYIFPSRVLHQPGIWTVRVYTQDESEFSVGFEISCVGSIHTREYG